MPKNLQVQAFKYLVFGGLAYLAYKKITGAAGEAVEVVAEFASTKLNPASDENIIYTAVGDAVGQENLSDAGVSFFDGIDTAAEWLGFENGINGVKGTTAELTAQVIKQSKGGKLTAQVIRGPITKEKYPVGASKPVG